MVSKTQNPAQVDPLFESVVFNAKREGLDPNNERDKALIFTKYQALRRKQGMGGTVTEQPSGAVVNEETVVSNIGPDGTIAGEETIRKLEDTQRLASPETRQEPINIFGSLKRDLKTLSDDSTSADLQRVLDKVDSINTLTPYLSGLQTLAQSPTPIQSVIDGLKSGQVVRPQDFYSLVNTTGRNQDEAKRSLDAAYNIFEEGLNSIADKLSKSIEAKERAKPSSISEFALQAFMKENPNATVQDILNFNRQFESSGSAPKSPTKSTDEKLMEPLSPSEEANVRRFLIVNEDGTVNLDTELLEGVSDSLRNEVEDSFDRFAYQLARKAQEQPQQEVITETGTESEPNIPVPNPAPKSPTGPLTGAGSTIEGRLLADQEDFENELNKTLFNFIK